MIRILALISGLAGAAAMSQFPEFSQQYLQRLSGAVNELCIVVTGFDIAAAAAGRTREEALAELKRDEFEHDLQRTLVSAIRRFERLDGDLAALRGAGPLGRMAQPWNMADRDLLRATMDDYQAAVPVTVDGAISAGVGYFVGWGVVVIGLGALLRPFRRRSAPRAR